MENIKELLEQYKNEFSPKVPEFNGLECKNGCNCALIHVEGDENKLYEIKGGYLCLEGSQNKTSHEQEVERLHSIENELIDLIHNTGDFKLVYKFNEWQDQRSVCNNGFFNFVDSL